MPDLIEQFFTRDLTEAEEDALERSLLEDDRAAERFGGLVAAAYARTGLPDPGGSGPTGSPGLDAPPSTGPWVLATAAFVLLSVMGGVAAYLIRANAPAPAPVTAPTPLPPAVEPAREPKPPRPAAKPQVPVPQKFQMVKVVVNQAAEGPVTVWVVGPDGSVVQNLYEGRLQAGKWSFGWDGKGASGGAVSPGTYRVEIHSDAGTQQREVVVK